MLVVHVFPTGLYPLVALNVPNYHLYLIHGTYARTSNLCWHKEHPTFYTYTSVPPHPLIQYSRFTAARKNLKIKKINGS
jgi:hypothetical protein